MITHSFLNLENVTHGFFNSKGGVSKKPYDSLNCSFNNGDHLKNVLKNYEIVKKRLKIKHLFKVNQVHSSKVITIKNIEDYNSEIDGDGLVTNLSDVGISILTADCCPVLLLDKQNKIIGACHAGWKGAVSGIIESTIEKMEKIGANKNFIVAVMGPTIQKHSYEIGNDVYNIIKNTNTFNQEVISKTTNGKYLFDLPLFINHKLLSLKISKIGNVNIDTYTNNTFFSHRRKIHEILNNKENNKNILTGRQISIIGLT